MSRIESTDPALNRYSDMGIISKWAELGAGKLTERLEEGHERKRLLAIFEATTKESNSESILPTMIIMKCQDFEILEEKWNKACQLLNEKFKAFRGIQ